MLALGAGQPFPDHRCASAQILLSGGATAGAIRAAVAVRRAGMRVRQTGEDDAERATRNCRMRRCARRIPPRPPLPRDSPRRSGENFLERREALRIYKFQQAQFEMQARVGLAPQVVIGGQQGSEKSREIFFAESGRLFREAGALVGRRGDQIGIRAADARDQQIAEMANRFAAKVLQDFARR